MIARRWVNKKFGQWLLGVLKKQKVTRRELAYRIGMDPSNLVLWINEGHPPRVEIVEAIALALGVSVETALVMSGHLRFRSNGGRNTLVEDAVSELSLLVGTGYCLGDDLAFAIDRIRERIEDGHQRDVPTKQRDSD